MPAGAYAFDTPHKEVRRMTQQMSLGERFNGRYGQTRPQNGQYHPSYRQFGVKP